MKDSIIDVTNELDTVQRAMLVSNCPDGILIGGKSDGQQYSRRFASRTMTKDNEVYGRTGEIMYCYEYKKYIVVYRFYQTIEAQDVKIGIEAIEVKPGRNGTNNQDRNP